MSEQEPRKASVQVVAFASADDDTCAVRLVFSPEFYRRPVKEQTDIAMSILTLARDELSGISETEIDRLESEVSALKAMMGIAA